jgi:hypothetical protein
LKAPASFCHVHLSLSMALNFCEHFQMDDPPPLSHRPTEDFALDPGSGSDTSESSAHAIAPGNMFVFC